MKIHFKILIPLFLGLIYNDLKAQTIETFERLECHGEMPDDLKKYFLQELNNITLYEAESTGKLSKKDLENISIIGNYNVKQDLLSGKVLYGDSLSLYAGQILNRLLKHYENEIPVSVYTYKSLTPNAFALPQGLIFISTGLWAQFKNEANVAMTIAHELQHIIEKHTLNAVARSKAIYNTEADSAGAYYKFKRDLESQADSFGYLLALKAGYDSTYLIEMLDILSNTNRPWHEEEYDFSYLEDNVYVIPKRLRLITTSNIPNYDDRDDRLSTHPNIKNRKLQLRSLPITNSKGNYLEGSEALLKRLVALARFEVIYSCILNRNYLTGLYLIKCLEDEYPNQPYLLRAKCMMWYGHAVRSQPELDKSKFLNFRYYAGEHERFIYFFHSLKPYEPSVIAAKYIWDEHKKHPEDSFIQRLSTSVLREVLKHKENQLPRFYTRYNTGNVPSLAERELNFVHFAFWNLMEDVEFVNAINKADREKEFWEKRRSRFTDKVNIRLPGTDVDTLLLLTPSYGLYDFRGKSYIKNLKKENKNASSMSEALLSSANDVGIYTQLLGSFASRGFSTKEYNAMSLFLDFKKEKFMNYGLFATSFSSQFASKVSQEFGTTYIGTCHITNLDFRRRFNGSALLLCTGVPYAMPLYLKWQLGPKRVVFFHIMIFDLAKDEMSFVYRDAYLNDIDIYQQQARVYHALNQINRD